MNISTATAATPNWLELVRQNVESLAFGSVQIIVHEGKVMQVDRTEKTRVAQPGPGSARHTDHP